ncbi:efflux RND transporter permease subunit [Paenibacillus cymbidii]|uniref:efflux RND transporter permease subunit n=1 Tax=Paenibacillus cymbidii TaxID=1639034 RepID=UPI0010815E3E|nr:efflux RND transporter permease subunit [Paenibacillus cymbidii]
MKGLINFSLNNKFAVWIMTIIVTVAGLYAGFGMKQESLPDVSIPYLTITTVYPGAAPEEVAEHLTKPLETRIRNLDGVKTISSTSTENVSSIVAEYNYKQNMDKAASDVREAIAGVRLPAGAQAAAVSRISLDAMPVISLSVAEDGKSLPDLTDRIVGEIKPALEGLAGVANVEVAGQQLQEVQLAFNTEKMKTLGLSENEVAAIVQSSAVKVPLGVFEMDQAIKTVVVDGNVATLDELNRLPIPLPSAAAGQPQQQAAGKPAADTLQTVRLNEIAKLALVGKAESISRTNGNESIGIQIVKAPEANTVNVVNAIKKEMERFEKDWPGLHVTTMSDQGTPIEKSVSTMLSKALFGALFAVLIILLFLRNFRTTLISIVSIPLSLLIGILLLKRMDITLNLMTLGAMTVAIGRVVDDSIVVIENIYRRMSLSSEKLKGKELIREATREMFLPILSSTVVTVAVFLPLGTVDGMIGAMFLPFGLTVMFALLASLLVAVTIVPMLGHSMFKRGVKDRSKHDEHPGALGRLYKGVLRWALGHKLITFGSAMLLLVGSLTLIPRIGFSLFPPSEDDKYVMISYTPAAGERAADIEQVAQKAEALLLKRDGVKDMQYSVGGRDAIAGTPSKAAQFLILYNKDFNAFAEEKKTVIEDLKQNVAGSGEWKQLETDEGLGGNKLSLYVYGDSMEEIKPAVDRISQLLKSNADFEKPGTSLSQAYGQYTLVADPNKLGTLGLTAGQIAMKLSPVRERPVLTHVKVDGKQYEVYVQTDAQQFRTVADIEKTTVVSPVRGEVPLKEIVQIKEGDSPQTIARRDNRMYAEVTATIVASNVSKASSDLEQAIQELKLPSTIDVHLAGAAEQVGTMITQLGMAMAAAIAIIYLVLVITFGGALAPFAILFSLPFALIGGLLGLFLAGESLSVSAMMGALMLIGIVVTNAIVLIDRVTRKEKEGLPTREALLEAAATRLRPILMTALATIGALLPLAFGFESSGIISKGLGIIVIGGLTSSTLLTLVIVPVVYEFLMKFRSKRIDHKAIETIGSANLQ